MSQDEKKPIVPPPGPSRSGSDHNSATASSGSSSGSASNPPSTPSSNDALSDFKAVVDARLSEVKEKLHHVCSEIYDRVIGNNMATHTRQIHMWPMDPTKYQIRSCIGRGGVGDVFLAWNRETMNECALKTITINADNSQQLIDELRILNKLRYVHIIRMHSAFLTDDVLCIVMPYMYSLRRVAHVHITSKAPRTPAFDNTQITEILYQTLQGLSFMHEKNFIHRDLKCDNILISEEGCIKIGDLGLTKMIRQNFKPDSRKWQRVMRPVGTAGYMAPEVVEHLYGKPGSAPYDFSCDIWSLGMCITEMVLADNPFYGMDDDAVQRAVLQLPRIRMRAMHPEGPALESKCSPNLLDLISVCLEKNPRARPSASALLSTHPLFVGKTKADFEFVAKYIVPIEVTMKVREMEYVDAERDEKLKRLKLSYCVPRAGQDGASGSQFETYQRPAPRSQFTSIPAPGLQKGLVFRFVLRHKVKDYLLSRDVYLGLDIPLRQVETVLRQSLLDLSDCEAMDFEDYLKTCREAMNFLLELTNNLEYPQRRYITYTGTVIEHRLQRCCLMECVGMVYGEDFSVAGSYYVRNMRKRHPELNISMNNSS